MISIKRIVLLNSSIFTILYILLATCLIISQNKAEQTPDLFTVNDLTKLLNNVNSLKKTNNLSILDFNSDPIIKSQASLSSFGTGFFNYFSSIIKSIVPN